MMGPKRRASDVAIAVLTGESLAASLVGPARPVFSAARAAAMATVVQFTNESDRAASSGAGRLGVRLCVGRRGERPPTVKATEQFETGPEAISRRSSNGVSSLAGTRRWSRTSWQRVGGLAATALDDYKDR